MKMSEEFPSKFLKAGDLQGREVRVIMQNVEREQIGQNADDTKPILYFKGKERGLVLNKTNANTISDAYGDDTDDWLDQPLILFPAMVAFQGKTQPAIRCRVPTAKDNKAANTAKKKPDPISTGLSDFPGDRPMASAELDDPIEF
jgi:hypothetical protein